MKKPRSCVLVIHGIGEQDKYDTLDLFTRNLVETIQGSADGRIHVTHTLMKLGDDLEDLIRIKDEGYEQPEIDIHEYHWAHNMERLISFGESVQWMVQVTRNVERHYQKNEEFVLKYEPQDHDAGRFKWRWVLKNFGWVMSVLYLFVRITGLVVPRFMDPFIRSMMSKPTQIFADYVGDVAIYTAYNNRAKYYMNRERVLRGCVEKIINLMKSDYERIVIAAHSLGSVIAYDALNEINLRMHVDEDLANCRGKLAELITLGSPLDKIAYFFREQTEEPEYVKRLVINHLKAFRWRDLATFEDDKLVVSSTVKNYLEHIRWYNYWDPKDPIAGHLDFYSGVCNIKIDTGQRWGYAHLGYWSNKQIYLEAVQRGQQERAQKQTNI